MAININIEGTKELTKSLTDTFSSVTESFGMLGDRVRVYRKISLLRSLKKAREIAHEENLELKEPSLKFLIPFIEECSLEKPEDTTLIDMWAKLLTSASTSLESQHNVYIRILREITNAEAKLIEYITSPSTHQHFNHGWHLDDVEAEWKDPYVYIKLRDCIASIGRGQLDHSFPFNELELAFRSDAESPGNIVYFFDISKGTKGTYPLDSIHTSGRGPIDDEFNTISISILKSLGILGDYQSSELWFGDYVIEVSAYYLTQLGAHFVKSCTRYKVTNR